MCAVVIAALVINLTCFMVAVLNLSSGEPHSSSNCGRSYRSSLDGMDSVIGHRMHRNQCRHYYQESKDAEVQMGAKRGAGRGTWLHSLLGLQRHRTICVSIGSSLSDMRLPSPSRSLIRRNALFLPHFH